MLTGPVQIIARQRIDWLTETNEKRSMIREEWSTGEVNYLCWHPAWTEGLQSAWDFLLKSYRPRLVDADSEGEWPLALF